MIIRRITITELRSHQNIYALLKEYEVESKIAELPDCNPQWATYETLEQNGFLVAYGGFNGDTLMGFVVLLTNVLPHYGKKVTTTESFFVAKTYRKTGLGKRLLDTAEIWAMMSGSEALMISAPSEGVLAKVLPRSGYRETNRVFFKGVKGD